MVIFVLMSTKELKELIHHKIDETDDESVLREISTLLDSETDLWDQLSEEEKQAINEGVKDADEGRLYTSEEVKNQVKKWLLK